MATPRRPRRQAEGQARRPGSPANATSGDTPPTTRRLVVVTLTPLTTFRRKDNSEGTLYEVEARTPDGAEIREPLRTFQELPIGEPIEVAVERYEHERHGVSYTLKRAKRRLGQEIDDLRERVQVLERHVGVRSDSAA